MTNAAVAKLAKICVRRPAGFRVLSRWSPTIAPSKVAATNRIITWDNCFESLSFSLSQNFRRNHLAHDLHQQHIDAMRVNHLFAGRPCENCEAAVL